jgi:hypothetical protein
MQSIPPKLRPMVSDAAITLFLLVCLAAIGILGLVALGGMA